MAQIDTAIEQQVLDIRSDRAKRTYISTTSRMISGDKLKHRDGLGGLALDLRGIFGR